MKKSWLADAAIGLVLTLVVAAGYLAPGIIPTLETLELKTYDQRAKLRTTVDAGQELVLVTIDDASIAALGRWPWPRARVAELLDKLREKGRPKVIGLDVVYSEADENQGLAEVQGLQKQYEDLLASRKIVDKTKSFDGLFSSATVRLDNDSKLLASLKDSGNVLLPMFFAKGALQGAKAAALPPVFSSSTVGAALSQGTPEPELPDGMQAIYPIVPFAEAAMGVGHVQVDQDIDGVVRSESPVLKYGDSRYPSFALLLASSYLGLKPTDIVWTPGQKVSAGRLEIPLTEGNHALLSLDPEGTYRAYSFADVLNDKVSPDVFKDKIVLIGPTATGVGTTYTTPVAAALPGVELVANVVSNVLHKRFVVRPPFAQRLELGLIAAVGLFLMLLLPRLKALWGFLAFLLIELALLGAGTYLFINGQWVKVAYPGVLLLAGYVLIVTRRFFSTEKGKELVEASAIETNKMLGLSFQGSGNLDMAFDKFRLCPLDDSLKDLLYNLALDFERKRQFNKSAAVLDHIAAKDAKYKDVVEKSKKLKQASDGAVFGGVGGGKKDGTVMLAGAGSAKPTLGRYEIEKELGRGAMGIVYLGKDPKINRQVAIKTMMLEEGSDAAEAKAVKERFFREAESAGTLNHPNIVRIFDAGEEQDIAYIAMELLDGHDFTRYTKKPDLLPIPETLEAVATVADALDYAHAQGIVHRDIKPANFMKLKDGTIRVADFGIARITTSSKTATGTVMGTPSYMSPEQVAGKKVDGRSDLFSLTVALFELLTGDKPFKGEEIGTLVFAIANNPHPDPAALRPDLPACVKSVIDKGLAKDPGERYARGSQLAKALRECLAKIQSGEAAPEAPAAQADAGPASDSPRGEAAPAEISALERKSPEPALDIPAPTAERQPEPILDIPEPAQAPKPSADWVAEAAPTLAAAAAESAPAAEPELEPEPAPEPAAAAKPAEPAGFNQTADDVLASLATVSMTVPDPEPAAANPPTAEVAVPGLPDVTVPSISPDATITLDVSPLTISPVEDSPSKPAAELPSLDAGPGPDATIQLTLPPTEEK